MTTEGAKPAGNRASGRNLVVCLDGTTNEPETGSTNAARMFLVAEKNDRQLVYYDPGVGTMGARAAVTQLGRAVTRFAGMVVGYEIHDNIEQAYTWLAHRYRAGDRIFVFGFSRAAYTAQALTGMLRTVGLLHADADNPVPYALKLYAKSGPISDPNRWPDENTQKAEREFWKQLRDDFRKRFGNPDFPGRFRYRRQVRFLGVWDTVKLVGWLNMKARIQVGRWPFTANIDNVQTARHALAIDERRRPFSEYRFTPKAGSTSRDFQEVWFAGMHGDIGGQNRADCRLPDITFTWIAKEAQAAGLRIDLGKYKAMMGVHFEHELPSDRALGVIRRNASLWCLAGGWRTRPIRANHAIHPSVQYRVKATCNEPVPYRPPNLPKGVLVQSPSKEGR